MRIKLSNAATTTIIQADHIRLCSGEQLLAYTKVYLKRPVFLWIGEFRQLLHQEDLFLCQTESIGAVGTGTLSRVTPIFAFKLRHHNLPAILLK